MALVLDYEFDNFSTATDGTRKVVDASGNSNDGTMESGQFLEFDGTDDYIDTGLYIDSTWISAIFSFTPAKDSSQLFHGGSWNSTPERRFGLARYGGNTFWEYSDASYFTGGALNVGQTYRGVLTYESGIAKGYIDGLLDSSQTCNPLQTETDQNFTFLIGRDAKDSTWYYGGKISAITILSAPVTSADATYDFNNPSAIIEMAITGIDNTNFSFQPSNIKHCFVLDEGTGNVIHDLVSGQSHSMLNFPVDDTQWTNADLQPYGHQKLRFKKDVNGNPSALAEQKTVRFD